MLKSGEVGGATILLNFLNSGQETFLVHSSCRKSFTDSRQHKKMKVDECECSTHSTVLQSLVESFSQKTKCFFCIETATVDRKQSFAVQSAHLAAIRSVCTFEITETVINNCRVRNDDLSLTVLGRWQSCCHFVAEDAVYHNTCLSHLLQNKNLAATRSDSGRPQYAVMCEVFEQICDLLESSCENDLFCIDQLHQRMTDIMQTGLQ